jgi:hypothetical protein
MGYYRTSDIEDRKREGVTKERSSEKPKETMIQESNAIEKRRNNKSRLVKNGIL